MLFYFLKTGAQKKYAWSKENYLYRQNGTNCFQSCLYQPKINTIYHSTITIGLNESDRRRLDKQQQLFNIFDGIAPGICTSTDANFIGSANGKYKYFIIDLVN